jgi:cytochrome b561
MASMDDLITKYIIHLSMDLLILLVSILGMFFLTSSGIALIPLKVVQLIASNQQSILTNITTIEIELLSQSIKINIVLLHYTELIIAILSGILSLLDFICYLKAKRTKHSSNY